MSIVSLVSGGLDSSLMSILIKQERLIQYPLFVDYGQRAAKQEWRACQKIHAQYGLPTPVRMDLRGYGKLIPSGLTNRRMRLYEDAFLPGRNLLFLLAAASYGYAKNSDSVAIGLLSDAFRLFPDQTREFINKAQGMIQTTLNREVKIVTPLMDFSKKDVLRLAKRKGIHGTYSCHSGQSTPCRKCVSCLEIINALGEKGELYGR